MAMLGQTGSNDGMASAVPKHVATSTMPGTGQASLQRIPDRLHVSNSHECSQHSSLMCHELQNA